MHATEQADWCRDWRSLRVSVEEEERGCECGLEGLEFRLPGRSSGCCREQESLVNELVMDSTAEPHHGAFPPPPRAAHSGTPCPRRKALTSAVTFHDIGCFIFISVHALVSGKLKASKKLLTPRLPSVMSTSCRYIGGMKSVSCQQRYRWHLEKNATQLARMQPRCQRYRGGSRPGGGPRGRACPS